MNIAAAINSAQVIIDKVTELIIQPIVTLLFALGFLVFIWGLVVFIANPTSSAVKEKGKKHMIYGTIGLMIMLSIWGIVGIVKETFNLDCSQLKSGKPCK